MRTPAAVDRFYTSNTILLREEIKTYVTNAEPRQAIAVMCPHAGYPYSGQTACAALSEVVVPDTVIILGPNHFGAGARVAIMNEGSWQMPFGEVQIDEDMAASIQGRCDFLEHDPTAHAQEHSLEVQVPLLQYFNPQVKIVPIVIGAAGMPELKTLGKAIALAIKELKTPTLIVASTDMSHTQNSNKSKQARINKLDLQALEQVTRLDEDGFMQVVVDNDLTACGFAAVAATIVASKKLGAKKGTLMRYSTSQDINDDYSYVVGYAGVVIE